MMLPKFAGQAPGGNKPRTKQIVTVVRQGDEPLLRKFAEAVGVMTQSAQQVSDHRVHAVQRLAIPVQFSGEFALAMPTD